ncbi:MAG: hypothetical protein WD847_06435 [Pirellulales bacterium]
MTRLEHRRTAVREGVGVLIGVSATMFGLAAFYVLFFWWTWDDDWLFVIAGFAILAVVFLVAATYAIVNISRDGEFVCRIDGDTIECVSPVKGCGETFMIRIADIVKVEKEEDSRSWYIWDRAGNRYWLTGNYGNPARKFIHVIREMNESITETCS